MTSHALPRLMVAGLSGGSGKTFFTLGLIRALSRQGLAVTACKKGPDYIDAAWLALAAGPNAGPKSGSNTTISPHPFWGTTQAPVNLDPFFLDDARLRDQLVHRHAGPNGPRDLAIIEGNRGLFDGRDLHGSCSTAALARALDCPVVMVINATKMTRTAAAVVAGLAAFEPFRFAGVVFNQVGTARHARMLRQAVETHTSIPVLGLLPRLSENPLPERHMGLAGGHASNPAVEAALDAVADHLTAHCDLSTLLQVARHAPPLKGIRPFWSEDAASAALHTVGPRPRIGVIRDEALWFYYQENLEALERAGADLVPLRLLEDDSSDLPNTSPDTWDALDGLYLGGGFPEAVAEALSRSLRLARLRHLAETGLPIYAECGGLMVLCHSLKTASTETPLAGVLPLRAVLHPRPQGLGYVEADVLTPNPYHPGGAHLRGHEFHYSCCEALDGNPLFGPNTDAPPALTLTAGTGMGRHAGRAADGWLTGHVFAAYTHIFAPAVPHWAKNFVQAARAHKRL